MCKSITGDECCYHCWRCKKLYVILWSTIPLFLISMIISFALFFGFYYPNHQWNSNSVRTNCTVVEYFSQDTNETNIYSIFDHPYNCGQKCSGTSCGYGCDYERKKYQDGLIKVKYLNYTVILMVLQSDIYMYGTKYKYPVDIYKELSKLYSQKVVRQCYYQKKSPIDFNLNLLEEDIFLNASLIFFGLMITSIIFFIILFTMYSLLNEKQKKEKTSFSNPVKNII